MRCPSCGARNTGSAEWCTQCYATLRVTDPPGDEPATPPPPEPPTATPPPPPTGSTDPAGPAEASQRDIRIRGETVEWRCAACDGWSSLDAPACTTCGAPRAGFGSQVSAGVTPAARVDPTTALIASVLLPGLGHLLRGRPGTGLARMVLWLLWGGGGLALLLGSGGGMVAGVLLLAAVLVWGVTLVDLQRLAVGREPLATARVLAWSVVGVTIVLALFALAAATGAGAPSVGSLSR